MIEHIASAVPEFVSYYFVKTILRYCSLAIASTWMQANACAHKLFMPQGEKAMEALHGHAQAWMQAHACAHKLFYATGGGEAMEALHGHAMCRLDLGLIISYGMYKKC